jgi:N-hydroxyarylamine O-acetyltransferase
MTIDIDAYCARIGYDGPRTPTHDVLCSLHALHPVAIAFENLDPLLKRPVRLDAASLERKLVHEGRGGYCFEQNLLFSHVLQALGFHVRGLSARVLWNIPPGKIMPRVHMLLHVTLDATPYVADVGFGGMTLTAPLRLESGPEQATLHEPFRLLAAGEGFELQAKVRGAWKPVYHFDLREQTLADYEVANWYHSTSPDSHFNTMLIVARPGRDCRYALRNNELAVHHLHGTSERRVLGSTAEIRDTLTQIFNLTLPDDPKLDVVLGRFAPAVGTEGRA